jgi:F-type H+-transporting ATPase subunit b
MKKFLTVVVLSVVVCGAVCVASAQEKTESAEQHEQSLLQLVSRWANFLILFGGLAFLLKKPMSDFFRTRQNDITGGLKRAEDAQSSAQARMDEIERRLAHLSSDITALRAETQKESLVDRERVLADAKSEVERIIEQSQQEIERVARTVEREIKEHIADLVIDRAGNTLRTEMTQDDQKRIVVRFIEQL